MILDANADPLKVKAMLKKQHDQIEQLQHKAYLYKSHQKNFKV
jgi:hypothetical protein